METAIATYYCTRNLEYHGDKGTLSQECIQQATALQAMDIYKRSTLVGTLSPTDSHILHRHNINVNMNWTKQQLDVYLATAEAICEWNVEPG
jgi:hypothetical protein